MTEIFIEGFEADVTKTEGVRLTRSINDIRAFTTKQTTFTRSLLLPGTPTNNKLFGFAFDPTNSIVHNIGAKNVGSNYKPYKASKCYVYVDSMLMIKGVIRLLQVHKRRSGVEYECTIYGELGGFVSQVGERVLTDIDFSAYNFNYTHTAITNSWANIGTGAGMTMPLIDYGVASTNKVDYDFSTFRPAFHAKEYWDKIFAAAGYTYDCPFISTNPFFKRILIPHNEDYLYKLTDTLIQKGNVTGQLLTSGAGATPAIVTAGVPFANGTMFSFTSNGNNTEFTFNGAQAITIYINYVVNGNFFGGNGQIQARFKFFRNGTLLKQHNFMLNDPALINPTSFSFSSLNNQLGFVINPGDVIKMVGEIGSFQTPSPGFRVDLTAGGYLQVKRTGLQAEIAVYNDAIQVQNCIPKNVKQIDFITSIINMFNLHVVEDRDREKHLIIKPYFDFYQGPTAARNWEDKIDHAKDLTYRPMSEITARYLKFKFEEDEDYFNEKFRKTNGKSYGDRIIKNNYDFADGEKEIKVIFSPTIISAPSGVDKKVSAIYKKTDGVEERTGSNIRILQGKVITGVANWNIRNGLSGSILTNRTDYAYAGHLDNPAAPTNDLLWEQPDEVYYDATGTLYPTNNLYTAYWENFIKEIVHENSSLLTAYLNLNKSDMYQMDFSRWVYLFGCYWRLNKVYDYDTEFATTTRVEFLKVIKDYYE